VKRAFSGGDHANVNRDAFFTANPSDLVIFENTEEFRLKLGLHLGYFVEEDSAAIWPVRRFRGAGRMRS
jgi:hypothetical protein